MIKKLFLLIFICLFFGINANVVLAHHIKEPGFCFIKDPNGHCEAGLVCKPLTADPSRGTCEKSEVGKSFGTINPPPELLPFTSPDPTGAGGISRFLSNLVGLIYAAAGVVLIFMLLWGGWDWMTSEGDKEKLDSARKKIINAVVGILLLAITFAVIQVLGQFTGFKFFEGQK
ncbi:hypothetical protein HYZ06_00965 [Candidatus Daviesbacteria bacterium]|nr:hypothetical protein [Candidatus Daviesbacteria bacterium]